jgi:hypothetical protein
MANAINDRIFKGSDSNLVRIDAGFTGVFDSFKERGFPKKPSMPFEEQLHYKYQMVIDGNSYVERLPKYLGSGSVVFRAGLFSEWFEERIKPWREYVPVDLEYAKLLEIMIYIREHDDEAQRIAQQSRETATLKLRQEDANCYLARLILEYSSLLENVQL